MIGRILMVLLLLYGGYLVLSMCPLLITEDCGMVQHDMAIVSASDQYTKCWLLFCWTEKQIETADHTKLVTTDLLLDVGQNYSWTERECHRITGEEHVKRAEEVVEGMFPFSLGKESAL